MTISADFALTSSGTMIQNDLAAVQSDVWNGSSTDLPSTVFSFTDGVAVDQANKWYRAKRTLAPGNDDLNLAGGLTAPITGAALTFTAIKSILMAVYSPDGTKLLRVGPAAVANPFIGPFKGTNPYVDVPYMLHLINPSAAGWSVTAGTGDILRITNPGATSVDYAIWIIGI